MATNDWQQFGGAISGGWSQHRNALQEETEKQRRELQALMQMQGSGYVQRVEKNPLADEVKMLRAQVDLMWNLLKRHGIGLPEMETDDEKEPEVESGPERRSALVSGEATLASDA